MNLLNTIDYWV